MSKNIQAFPQIDKLTCAASSTRNLKVEGSQGMILRDYFAAKAMQTAISDFEKLDRVDSVHVEGVTTVVARMAYQMADAMLKAREA
jgi:hypothetical protein